MKGNMMMHSSEKIPWKSEGALHAQVDSHWPVPNVMPAAISAPTLLKLARNPALRQTEPTH